MAESPTSSPDEAAHERDELPATKVNIPRTRPDHLGRARLIQRLNPGDGPEAGPGAHARGLRDGPQRVRAFLLQTSILERL